MIREIRGASPDPLVDLFQELFRSLADARSPLGWTAVLDPETLGDHERLLRHAWENFLGPKLRENEETLQASAAEVLALWDAAGHLCGYICRFLVNCREQNLLTWNPSTNEWEGAENFIVDAAPDWPIRNIEWSRPVLVGGAPEGVWHNPAAGRWCLVQMGVSPSDLAQLCFYREILRTNSISLIRFRPDLQHDTFTEDQLESAKPELMETIGKLAGVISKQTSTATAISPPAA